jgi:hypothetical protein
MVAGSGFEHCRRKPTDLQSVELGVRACLEIPLMELNCSDGVRMCHRIPAHVARVVTTS